jgi:hypothetical protein
MEMVIDNMNGYNAKIKSVEGIKNLKIKVSIHPLK